MDNPVFIAPDYPLMYRAVGLVRGYYIPSKGKLSKGTLITDDGLFFPANLVGNAGFWPVVNKHIIRGDRLWSAYVHTHLPQWYKPQPIEPIEGLPPIPPPEERPQPKLWFELHSVRIPKEGQTFEDLLKHNNYFSIRGEIIEQNEEQAQISVRICRNKILPGKEQRLRNIPFTLNVEGFLPGKVTNQFWDLDVIREGETLILENATFVADLTPPPEVETKTTKAKTQTKSKTKTQAKSKAKPPEPPPVPELKLKRKTQAQAQTENQAEPKSDNETKPKGTGKIIRLF